MTEKVKYVIGYIFVLLVAKLSQLLNDKMRTRIAVIFSDIFFKLNNNRKKVTINNIKEAFPDKAEDQINYIAKHSYRNLTITFMELFAIKKMNSSQIRNKVVFENPQQIIDIYNQGKGIILLSAHYGNWELMAYAGRECLGFDMLIPVKILKNYYVDKYTNRIRTANGNKVVNMDHAAWTIIKTLKSGGALALLGDQAANESTDIFVKFFNKPALTYEAPAELALKFQIPFLECFPERQNDGTYIVRQNIIDYSDLEYSKSNVKILTQRHVEVLENQIRRIPEQWTWMHKRWKHSEKCKEQL